ncbi:tyrosine-type recombinase/integrase (plasmid) [Agrobacterium salinitolerans]|nr:tyrosine-type recombinase/integrase [Agrobacterium salinitolerans]
MKPQTEPETPIFKNTNSLKSFDDGHRPFKDAQVLNQILRKAYVHTGLKPPAPYVGAQILRHSLATNLVQNGASLEEISDTLRHRSRATTMIYARLDVEGLRTIAQPWPTTGGAA